jgi:hypothetical protein
MGHALELYTKGALVQNRDIQKLSSHKLHLYVAEIDSSFSLSTDAIEAGKALFSKESRSFDMGLQMKYSEELELYQIYYHLADLKYYVSREGQVIYPVVASTVPFNNRYLTMVGNLRSRMAETTKAFQNKNLQELLPQLGMPPDVIRKIL